jgi:hypothetical protein
MVLPGATSLTPPHYFPEAEMRSSQNIVKKCKLHSQIKIRLRRRAGKYFLWRWQGSRNTEALVGRFLVKRVLKGL